MRPPVVWLLAAGSAFHAGQAMTAKLAVFHADSLEGPMRAIKGAFEAKNPGVTIDLTSGVSRRLAERILEGDACDVFAPSSPAVVEEALMNKPIARSGKIAASWYVVFSANEMVIVTPKGNPLGIGKVVDLAKPDVKLIRVTGEKDLATGRTIEFIRRATELEGRAELAQKIVDSAVIEPGTATTVPDVVNAVKRGRANAGIVYYSAAMAARNDTDIVRFADSVNMSEAIRNAALVPGSAQHQERAIALVRFLLSPQAQGILEATGQPPVVPAIHKGVVPAGLR